MHRIQNLARTLGVLLIALGLAGAASHAAPRGDGGGVVNINNASVEQLTLLPGIGQAKAERIVAYRTKTPFKRVVELARVRGIGLKTVRKLKPWLRIEGATTLASPVKVPRTKAADTSDDDAGDEQP